MFFSHTRSLRDASVIKVEDVTPRVRRITVAGEGLQALTIDRPAMWMKLFFPLPSHIKPQGRAYSIREYHADQGLMAFDCALHGDHGPAGWGFTHVRKGDKIQLAGPRAGYQIDPAQREHVLIGDATALPAISGIVEKLGINTRAHAFIEVANAAEEQTLIHQGELIVHWVHSGSAFPGTTGGLELAVQQAELPKAFQVFLAGEAFMVRALRTHFLVDREISPTSVDAKGYWRQGCSDYRDHG